MRVSLSRWWRPVAAAAAMVLASTIAVPATALATETEPPEIDETSTQAPVEKTETETPTPEEGSVDPQAEDDFEVEITPFSVPQPNNSQSVVTVKVGSHRTGTDNGTIQPLAGATLGLFSSQNANSPVSDTWARCTSDADGDCSFTIPNTNSGGTNRDRALYVKAIEAPEGYHIAGSNRLGTGNPPSADGSTYSFRVGEPGGFFQPDWILRGGQTYRSTQHFMISSDNGSNTASNGVFQFVKDNPVIKQCGIDVALIFDLSGSVAGSQNQLVQASNTFVDALTGTDSSVSLYTFSTLSPATAWGSNSNTDTVLVPNHPVQQSVSTTSGADEVKAWYTNNNGNANFTPSGGTNWDRGLYQPVQSNNDYDVAIVLTDGNPTFHGTNHAGNGNLTRFTEVEEGIFSANALKEKGTRVVAVGVGGGVTSAASGLNLSSISGPNKGSDYFQTQNYAEAAAALQAMIAESCAGNITVVKQVVDSNTTGEDITGATPAAGWEFSAESSNSSVTFDPNSAQSTTGETSETGAVEFSLDFSNPSDLTDVTIEETIRDDYSLVTQDGQNAVCVDISNGNAPVEVQNDGEFGFTLADIASSANISCTVYNRPPVPHGSLTLIKDFDINYGGSDSTDPWTLTATKSDEDIALQFESGETNEQVEPGDYVIGEFYGEGSEGSVANAGYEHRSTVCTVDGNDAEISDDSSVTVAAGTDVVCTLTNADLPGSVEWLKVADNGSALNGSVWLLQGPGLPDGGVEIGDDHERNNGTETGVFIIDELWWGDYKLTEVQAPAGFVKSDAEYTFTISGEELHWAFDENFVNKPVQPGTLPLTGAFGGGLPYIAGAAAIIALIAVGWYTLRRKRATGDTLLDS
ncbi:MAG: SpaA isopeptide-forming pilin-related protein [Gulosibacter sp.]|uniref:SpaA isopeptide-forming pilin-related protein n=1 Tax=Gulosibacter sp. TaxID=2817531 RepID=UPI003F8F3171